MSFDEVSKQIELELHNASQGLARTCSRRTHSHFTVYLNPLVISVCSPPGPVEPGKFDLVYQNADGTESVEYAVSRDSRV